MLVTWMRRTGSRDVAERVVLDHVVVAPLHVSGFGGMAGELQFDVLAGSLAQPVAFRTDEGGGGGGNNNDNNNNNKLL